MTGGMTGMIDGTTGMTDGTTGTTGTTIIMETGTMETGMVITIRGLAGTIGGTTIL
ncbi:hypothetical protein Mal48_14570 [Thalassoglobus polymorphus]|uniref:Uncharacterized protein n=1 Tax=Thalassoglobus polymorphus TaxID=2527994 RepID=A0A517QKQ1_9PLAN|nr:hypothetical protein Mal48_14570 [Thalassoglobus polymorphus]